MIRAGRAVAAAVMLSAVPASIPAATALKPAPRIAAKQDWSRVVAATAEGGFRMGNPDAPVKLIEYGSLVCPHCRRFEQTGYRPLVQSYVRPGRVSFEFRNLLISGPDISVSLLARCSGPGKFFAMSQYLYATQPQWLKKLDNMSSADKQALSGMTPQQRVIRFAQIAGLGPVASRFGLSPARARQCLADPKALDRLLELTRTASASGIEHTPTFLIDGKIVDPAAWEELEPLLRQAAGRS